MPQIENIGSFFKCLIKRLTRIAYNALEKGCPVWKPSLFRRSAVYPILMISAVLPVFSRRTLERLYPRRVSSRKRVSSAIFFTEPDKTYIGQFIKDGNLENYCLIVGSCGTFRRRFLHNMTVLHGWAVLFLDFLTHRRISYRCIPL